MILPSSLLARSRHHILLPCNHAVLTTSCTMVFVFVILDLPKGVDEGNTPFTTFGKKKKKL